MWRFQYAIAFPVHMLSMALLRLSAKTSGKAIKPHAAIPGNIEIPTAPW